MDEQIYIIKFDNISAAEANSYANELKEILVDSIPNIKVDRKRDDPHTQDFGTTLVLILGAPAIVSLVHVLGTWLLRHRNASITIQDGKKKIIAHNITSKDAARLSELFLKKK